MVFIEFEYFLLGGGVLKESKLRKLPMLLIYKRI